MIGVTVIGVTMIGVTVIGVTVLGVIVPGVTVLGATVPHITDHFQGTILTDIKLPYDGTQAVPKRVEDCVSVVFTLVCI